ncbi:hypothetical protein TNCT_52991 [Trichonephila clavata]|uniref:Uncharacterized protein n=1 Tax=Trichonephila clavata TaxID=2740835 RepID=A0A8X6K8H7_TRICU|nr:hypothetical protein TNCT_52991 [Trichonephila clavata]
MTSGDRFTFVNQARIPPPKVVRYRVAAAPMATLSVARATSLLSRVRARGGERTDLLTGPTFVVGVKKETFKRNIGQLDLFLYFDRKEKSDCGFICVFF